MTPRKRPERTRGGYWVVRVDRKTGEATTHQVVDHDAAWQMAVDLETPGQYTTVVDRRTQRPSRRKAR